MTELTINQIIKIILGILVFVAVVAGVYIFFKEYFIDFFNNIVPEQNKLVFLAIK